MKDQPAFPVVYEHDDSVSEQWGMTLRDYFAAKAMQGIVAALHQGLEPINITVVCANSYAIADEMLKEKNG